jgi:histidinol-phosphate aminotransferase
MPASHHLACTTTAYGKHMHVPVTRRQFLIRGGTAAGAAFLSGCAPLGRAVDTSGPVHDDLVRLHLNENPYGPPESARTAMETAFAEANLYAWGGQTELIRLLARQHNLPEDHIMPGAGSSEILNAAGLVHALSGGEIVTAHPTYQDLTRYAERLGATIMSVPLDATKRFDLTTLEAAISDRTRLVYVCNPNNPTGTIIPGAALEDFCRVTSERVPVYVDEAYHDYVDDPSHRSMIGLVRDGYNVIVSRTASKIHGLAGMRIGFGFAQPEMIRRLREGVTGSVNVVGVRGVIASLQDNGFQNLSRTRNRIAKSMVYDFCRSSGLEYVPSETNFVLFRTRRPIEEFRAKMMSRGVAVGRPFPPYLDWCRVSMGKKDEVRLFLDHCHEVLEL